MWYEWKWWIFGKCLNWYKYDKLLDPYGYVWKRFYKDYFIRVGILKEI